ncbi:centrosomal protein of 55 kDa-like isoform X2 [Dicentrarchus labrax]|uniref:centrosomal protein of 55 kDa-like isoform X2 n=1 Tax=Dicentrarchus labrax TaxID=13489 RepID=UPI0021F571CC|nr:centrosomal protein of 55 kDa-like isoform X2 [Dicentrarchus labrax]
MASSKNKGFLWKKPNSELRMIVSSLKKENAYLKKTLVELSRQHSEHNKLVERFLSLETVRLESCQQLTGKDEEIALPPEQLSKKEGKLMDVDSTSDKLASTDNVVQLQNHLCEALEKNKQWLEYDQQREAYVRAILARMLWLEKQLNEANQARSQQHNEDHSHEKERISQMQEHYEGLLQKAKDELEVLRKDVVMTQQNLIISQNWCEDSERDVKELKLQLKAERRSRKSSPEESCSEDDEKIHRYETEELLHKLDEEKRRSANAELQANICQKFMFNKHHADQEKIADLERQIRISSQDLEDERQDCSYLKERMVRVLKMLRKTKRHVIKKSKGDQQSHSSFEMARPPSLPSRDILISSPHSSLLNESFLECPSCQAEYPVSHYRELLNHLEICVD